MKECATCRHRVFYSKLLCESCLNYSKWELKETAIQGVAEEETVSNNQGGKQSKLDYRFDLIDPKAIFALAQVLHEGAQKYEKDNWRKITTEEHLNHALSHIYAHLAGDKQDNHLSHAFTRLMMAYAVEKGE
jgi:hypothetical protein